MDRMRPRQGTVGQSSYTAYDHGAHLARWAVRGTPVVWVSEEAVYDPGTPVRGGVPVCWPWFANGPDGDRTPSHGFVRTAPWELLEHRTAPDRHRLRWQLTAAQAAGRPGSQTFPHDFRLQLQVDVAADLAVTLRVRNTDRQPWSFEAALHTYLHVGDVRRVRVEGLDDTGYWDKVTQRAERQQGPVRLSGETDRIYHAPAVVSVDDPVLDRVLRITPAGSTDTVVWNPWVEQAAGLPDLGDDEWSYMLCVETAVVGSNAIRLAPGQEHRLTARIALTGRDT